MTERVASDANNAQGNGGLRVCHHDALDADAGNVSSVEASESGLVDAARPTDESPNALVFQSINQSKFI